MDWMARLVSKSSPCTFIDPNFMIWFLGGCTEDELFLFFCSSFRSDFLNFCLCFNGSYNSLSTVLLECFFLCRLLNLILLARPCLLSIFKLPSEWVQYYILLKWAILDTLSCDWYVFISSWLYFSRDTGFCNWDSLYGHWTMTYSIFSGQKIWGRLGEYFYKTGLSRPEDILLTML